MKKIGKRIAFAAMIALSLLLKYVLVHCALTEQGFWVETLHLEPMNFLLNAAIFLILFSVAEKHIRPTALKFAVSFVTTILFTLQLLAENCYLMYLELNQLFLWKEPVAYGVFVRSALSEYFRSGNPSYHFAVLGMLLLCCLVVLFRRYRKRMKIAGKNLLLKLSERWNLIFCYDLLLAHFADCLTQKEYHRIKASYISELTSLHEEQLHTRFDELDDRFQE